jgi:hypothetical protein
MRIRRTSGSLLRKKERWKQINLRLKKRWERLQAHHQREESFHSSLLTKRRIKFTEEAWSLL